MLQTNKCDNYPIKLGIIINKTSGNGSAYQICIDKIFPKLNTLNYEYKVIDYLANEINELDGIIVVGGDGTIVKVVQYLNNNNINIPICPIPAGSGNGLAKSILFERGTEYSIDNACEMLDNKDLGITNGKQKINLFSVNNNLFGFLSVSWGVISDLDYKTEYFRKLGSFRFTLGGIYSLIRKTSYYGKLEAIDENNQKISIEGNFIYFLAANTSHISHNTYTQPNAKLDDGYMHITYLLDPISRYRLYEILSSLETGDHIKYLQYIKTKNFSLKTESGLIMVDGELLSSSEIDVKITEKLVNLI